MTSRFRGPAFSESFLFKIDIYEDDKWMAANDLPEHGSIESIISAQVA